jgi:hypothetical protein
VCDSFRSWCCLLLALCCVRRVRRTPRRLQAVLQAVLRSKSGPTECGPRGPGTGPLSCGTFSATVVLHLLFPPMAARLMAAASPRARWTEPLARCCHDPPALYVAMCAAPPGQCCQCAACRRSRRRSTRGASASFSWLLQTHSSTFGVCGYSTTRACRQRCSLPSPQRGSRAARGRAVPQWGLRSTPAPVFACSDERLHLMAGTRGSAGGPCTRRTASLLWLHLGQPLPLSLVAVHRGQRMCQGGCFAAA